MTGYLALSEVADVAAGGGFVTAIGALLLATGVFMRVADRRATGRREGPGLPDALLVGVLQGLAVLPGVSRSSTTVSAHLPRGHDGPASLCLSFVLSIPAAAGAWLRVVLDGGVAIIDPTAVLLALGVMAIVGYLPVGALVGLVRRVAFWRICVGFRALAVVGGVLILCPRGKALLSHHRCVSGNDKRDPPPSTPASSGRCTDGTVDRAGECKGMTDRIDLDELDDGDDRETGQPGDRIWRDDYDGSIPTDATERPVTDATTDEEANTDADRGGDRLPHVPRPNIGNPAGIPVESGGAGAGAGDGGSVTDEATGAAEESAAAASGPHDGGADELTMALTYEAARALANPRRVVADARGWADWIGLVGRVGAPVLNKFQRDEGVDLDFFNGSATGPGERLAGVDEHSMFYADRMVVVGRQGVDEDIAATADWEFVPLTEAAEEAGWEVEMGGQDL